MTPRSLFVKIFLWFWLAITVVIAALALVVWIYPYSAVPSGTLPDRLHELQVRGLLAVLESKGKKAYETHRRELDAASRMRTYVIDDQGRELSGQAVPDLLLTFAKEHEEEIEDGERVMIGEPSRLVIPLVDSKGAKYRALVMSERGFRAFVGGLDIEPRGGPGGDGGPGDPRIAPGDGFGGRGSRSGMGPGLGRGPGGAGSGPPRPPPDSTPGFELLVPVHVLLLRLLAMVLAAGLVCYALARYLTLPVRRLQQAAQQLASGDLTARAGDRLGKRRDEIGALGRDFDRMAGQVESLLTTHKRLMQDVSHELRSPLARLNVALELAARHAGPDAATALSRVRREADRLNELIGQLLTLARLEGGAAQTKQTKIDLGAMVNEVVDDADFEAAAGNRHVCVVRCDACHVVGTPELLRSAIENVMRNAVHYTAEGTQVEVSLRTEPGESGPNAVLEVRDHGPGVPEDALESIFQPFYRVSDARDRKSGGSGLGLAITHRAILLHGGEVHATNATLTHDGLVVRVKLPCAV